MPAKNQAKSLPANIVAQVLLGEAAGEGPEGLMFVRDVLVNRARKGKQTLEQVATQPKQFSAYDRPDLAEFFSRQPLALRRLALDLVQEAQQPDYVPKYPDITNYVTSDLYERRFEPGVASWIREMEPVLTVGRHVALKPRLRR